MFENKKVEKLEQEVEDLHRRLAEKDEELAKQVCVIMAQKREYESLKIAYDLLLDKQKQQQNDIQVFDNESQLADTKTL